MMKNIVKTVINVATTVVMSFKSVILTLMYQEVEVEEKEGEE